MAPDTQTKQKIESKPIVENKADADAPQKSGKKWILIGAVVVLLVAGSAAGALYYFKWGGKVAANDSKSEIHNLKIEPKATLSLEPFLVNLADTEESRFVKTTFQLALAEELKEEGKSVSTAAMRDSIITLLSSKTSDQILTPEGKDKLREEVRNRVKMVAPEINVLEVYIVDFVVQL
jgi:flagellar FliL protein